ncbi:MAG: SoxR reducing system RseC family protein [Firmicutes bacterium]|nr:SoxR reducing system RseC family protein [Bacillota bacterium]
MRQRGIVLEREDDYVVVQIQDPTRTCGTCNGCMRLTPQRPPEDYVVRIDDVGRNYVVGDEVIIEGQMGDLVKAVMVLYGVPFVSLFVGYGLTRIVLGSDPLAGLGAVGGLLAGALIARPLARRLSESDPELKIVARACS